MTKGRSLVERFAVAADMQSYSGRNTRRQDAALCALTNLLDAAAEETNVGREHWHRQPTGDGETAIVPPDIDMASIVGPFVTNLNALLTEHNDDHAPDMSIRLRMAMHIDAVMPGMDPTLPGAHRFPGPAVVIANRLLDCRPLRQALTEAAGHDGCNLAVMVSQAVYEKVVEAGLRGIRPGLYRPIRVHIPEKGFDQTGYLYVPGCNVHTFSLDVPPPAPRPEPDRSDSAGAPGVSQAVSIGDVHGHHVEIANLNFGPASGV